MDCPTGRKKWPLVEVSLQWALRTIKSHGTKSHTLGSKLHSGTSKTKAGQGGLVRVALFSNLRPSRTVCSFVPCDWIMQRVYSWYNKVITHFLCTTGV